MIPAVAVSTEVHANLAALRTALARIDELGIRRIYRGGGLLGHGPRGRDVERSASWEAPPL